jgi:hypothetical protein
MNSTISKQSTGGKRTRKYRNPRGRITKNNRTLYQSNIKIKSFKNIKTRHLPQKGIVYSIEKPDVISRDDNMEGDIIKKYINGKLVSQKFITKNKFLELAEKYKKMLFGGENVKENQIRPAEPTVVYVQDKTTFAQSFKSGLGFAFAFNIVGWLFGDN